MNTASTPNIDLNPHDLAEVQRILKEYVPQHEVWVFGSRAVWTAKAYSDLDLAIITDKPLSLGTLADLKNAFDESDLSIKVDLVDWATTGEAFREIIKKTAVVLHQQQMQPKEWRQSTWGDEISLEYGKSLRGYENTAGQYRVFGSNGPIGWTDEFLAQGPGVILGRKGAYRGVHFSPAPFFVIDTAYYVVPKTKLDMRWLYYAIKHYKLGEIDDGSPIPSTTRAAVYIKDLEVPPIDEQRAIAHILGTLDDKIELNRRMNETLEAMARALFKSWFVDFEPVRAKAEGRDTGLPKEIADLFPDSFEDSELGEVPKGWQLKSLYDTATFINGAAFKNDDFCESSIGLPVIKIAELKDGISAQTKYSCRNAEDKQLINTGDLLYSWSGSPDTSLDVFIWANGPGLLNQHIFKIVTACDSQKRFVYYLLKYLRPVLVEIARNKQTTGLGHITVADMKCLQICFPPPHVLAAFNNAAAQLFDKAFLNTLESRTLAAQRDTLLPKLLLGEIRVSNLEAHLC